MGCRDKGETWAGRNAEQTALYGLLIASAIGAAAGARFYPHYYVQLIPPLALLAAPYYARLWSGRRPPLHWLLRPWVAYTWLALTIIAFSVVHWVGLVPQRGPSEAGQYLFRHATTFENWRLTRIISLTFVMPSKYCRWATFDREVLGGTSELVWRGSKRELTRSAPLLPSVELMKYSANPRV